MSGRRPASLRPPVAPPGTLTADSAPPASFSSRRGVDPAIPCAVASKLIGALIVDDEPIARKVLREELELHSDIEIVGDADIGVRALEAIGS